MAVPPNFLPSVDGPNMVSGLDVHYDLTLPVSCGPWMIFPPGLSPRESGMI